ncbi:935_t:CDS:2 [Rhizophagus irregularis]|nr:935_t:CDS:2 [Rhizophagus irregularis]
MNTIKLCCLVLGDSPDERTFEVDIRINESISKLKDKIKDKKQNTFRNIDADQLDLLKVEISTIEKNEKLSMLRGSEIDVTKLEGESLNSSRTIVKYFPDQPLYEARPSCERVLEGFKKHKD